MHRMYFFPLLPSTGASGRIIWQGRCMDAERYRRVKNGPNGNPRRKRGAQSQRQPGRLLTHTFLVLALRPPLASRSAPANGSLVTFDCMDAGDRAPTVVALGDAGAVAEAVQTKVTHFRVRKPDLNNRHESDTFILKY
jgi:hypothetical protein